MPIRVNPKEIEGKNWNCRKVNYKKKVVCASSFAKKLFTFNLLFLQTFDSSLTMLFIFINAKNMQYILNFRLEYQAQILICYLYLLESKMPQAELQTGWKAEEESSSSNEDSPQHSNTIYGVSSPGIQN